MAIETTKRMSVAEYLAWEQSQECKHEYIDGEIIEMTGGTLTHSLIKVNVGGTLYALLDDATYVLCNSDMRLRVAATRYVYPDFSIVRGEPKLEDETQLTLLNPCFVIEVSSPSSATYDRVDKLGYYFDAPSIEACLIIEQDRIHADLFTRADEGWLLRGFTDVEDVIPLPMLGCELPLAQVYRGIAFEGA